MLALEETKAKCPFNFVLLMRFMVDSQLNTIKSQKFILLRQIGFLKEALLLTALKSGDEKVIGGLTCLMSEIGQAAPFLIVDKNTKALALEDAVLRLET
ncbi:hypothetical protein ACS0TY_034015 [Phlomoides rotata]